MVCSSIAHSISFSVIFCEKSFERIFLIMKKEHVTAPILYSFVSCVKKVTVRKLVASVHHLVHYCHHHLRFHRSIGRQIQILQPWMQKAGLTYRSPYTWDDLSSGSITTHGSDHTDHCCPTINTFCFFVHEFKVR